LMVTVVLPFKPLTTIVPVRGELVLFAATV
jgi:hypothetical protein